MSKIGVKALCQSASAPDKQKVSVGSACRCLPPASSSRHQGKIVYTRSLVNTSPAAAPPSSHPSGGSGQSGSILEEFFSFTPSPARRRRLLLCELGPRRRSRTSLPIIGRRERSLSVDISSDDFGCCILQNAPSREGLISAEHSDHRLRPVTLLCRHPSLFFTTIILWER